MAGYLFRDGHGGWNQLAQPRGRSRYGAWFRDATIWQSQRRCTYQTKLQPGRRKGREVYRKIQNEKHIHEKVVLPSQVLEAVEKVARLVWRAAAVEAVLRIANSPPTQGNAALTMRTLEHRIGVLEAYIEMQ